MASFNALPTFLNDARALASPNLTLLLAGNKLDLFSGSFPNSPNLDRPPSTSKESDSETERLNSRRSSIGYGLSSQLTATIAGEGREISPAEASRWASRASIPVSVEVSAYTGEGVEDVFARLAAMILTKIELGEIDPSDPLSGIQYGDNGGLEDREAVKSQGKSRRKGHEIATSGQRGSGMREWEAVFRLDRVGRRRRDGCC